MRITFIGAGNMAGAIIKGILSRGLVSAEEITAADLTDRVSEEYGIHFTNDNRQAVEGADVIFLSVKPQVYEKVIAEIRDAVTEDQLIITIAPGKTLAWLEDQFGRALPVVRTMPNTPAMVLMGMTAYCPNAYVRPDQLETAVLLLSSFGRAEQVPEHLMDVVTSVSGSSPAWVFMLIEAMADAAVLGGMPRAQACTFAAQAVQGSAKLALESGKHPGELKDMVCSPAGTTIEAVRVLERAGFRSAVIEAMDACRDKARKM